MEGLWKTLLDKISINIVAMTFLLLGLSLFFLIFFTKQISLILLIVCFFIFLAGSYFLSLTIFFVINKIKKRFTFRLVSSNFNKLSNLEKEALFSILISGDVGGFLDLEHEGCEKKLVLYGFIIAKSHNSYYDLSFAINPIYKNELSALLDEN